MAKKIEESITLGPVSTGHDLKVNVVRMPNTERSISIKLLCDDVPKQEKEELQKHVLAVVRLRLDRKGMRHERREGMNGEAILVANAREYAEPESDLANEMRNYALAVLKEVRKLTKMGQTVADALDVIYDQENHLADQLAAAPSGGRHGKQRQPRQAGAISKADLEHAISDILGGYMRKEYTGEWGRRDRTNTAEEISVKLSDWFPTDQSTRDKGWEHGIEWQQAIHKAAKERGKTSDYRYRDVAGTNYMASISHAVANVENTAVKEILNKTPQRHAEVVVAIQEKMDALLERANAKSGFSR